MNENNTEYTKVILDILEHELDLAPANPASTDPNERRVFLWNQNFILPPYDHMFVIVKENPGRTIHNKFKFTNDTPPKQIQEVLMQKEVIVDVLSRNAQARQRKEEVLLALSSYYSQDAQEKNGFKIFSHPSAFVDISEVEGAGKLFRFQTRFVCNVKYSKTKSVDYYDKFKNVSIVDD